MPMHDWTKVPAGIFHDFHQAWHGAMKVALNERLPSDYYALTEQKTDDFVPDVLTLHTPKTETNGRRDDGTVTLMERPKTRFRTEKRETYVTKKNTLSIRHVSGDRFVAAIEVLSPGNKDSKEAYRKLLQKIEALLNNGIHLLLIDPLPPTPRDPEGLQAAVAAEVGHDAIFLPVEGDDRNLSLVAYECANVVRWYLEPFRVGEAMIDMPIFLRPDFYVNVPLEATYEVAWKALPKRWRDVFGKAA